MGLLEHLPHCRADPEERVSQLRETTRSQIRQTTNPEMPPRVPAIAPWKVTLVSSTTERRVPALRRSGVARQASARKHNTATQVGGVFALLKVYCGQTQPALVAAIFSDRQCERNRWDEFAGTW